MMNSPRLSIAVRAARIAAVATARATRALRSWARRPPARAARTRATAGETLVEVLVAVLVSGFSMLMLYTAIATAGRIVQDSSAVATDYYATTDALVTATADAEAGVTTGSGVVEITVSQSDRFTGETIAVTYADGELPGGKQGVTYQTDQAEG